MPRFLDGLMGALLKLNVCILVCINHISQALQMDSSERNSFRDFASEHSARVKS